MWKASTCTVIFETCGFACCAVTFCSSSVPVQFHVCASKQQHKSSVRTPRFCAQQKERICINLEKQVCGSMNEHESKVCCSSLKTAEFRAIPC